MQPIRLIVGLGNPGSEYHRTRHNVGFDFVDHLAESSGASLSLQTKFFGHCGQATIDRRSVRLLKPNTYMNLSGQSVLALCQFHQIELDEILVVHDELDLTPGVIRLKTGGGHGGHNGLRNIIERFGGDKNFHRLRIGIGHPGHRSKVHGHVLSRAPADDQISIAAAIHAAMKDLPLILAGDFQKVMQDMHQRDFSQADPKD